MRFIFFSIKGFPLFSWFEFAVLRRNCLFDISKSEMGKYSTELDLILNPF